MGGTKDVQSTPIVAQMVNGLPDAVVDQARACTSCSKHHHEPEHRRERDRERERERVRVRERVREKKKRRESVCGKESERASKREPR